MRNWAATQTAHARAYLDALPYHRPLGERLMQLISQTSPSYSDLKAAGTGCLRSIAIPPSSSLC